MVTARDILQIWSHRLNMNHEGVTQWTPSLRRAIETLVENLRAVEPVESVELDVDPSRIPIAKFIRSKTGEILGEIDIHPGDVRHRLI
jgi:sugar-specific transcriptional regulator TrmB